MLFSKRPPCTLSSKAFPNYDAASWNVGKAAGDLVNLAVLAGSMFGRGLRERPVT